MFALMEKHRLECTRSGCQCQGMQLSDMLATNVGEAVNLNRRAYEKLADVPEKITKSWKLRMLSVLIADVKPMLLKSFDVTMALAEIAYYFFANYYQALLHLQSIEAVPHSLITGQYTTNLRNIIEEGMQKNTEEAQELLLALRFQTNYNKFLTCIEQSCECTVKFWTALVDEQPSQSTLTRLGHELYDTSQSLFLLVHSIDKASPNHFDFLLKFGLYAKHILHDKISATHAFQRILWNADNFVHAGGNGGRKDQMMTLVVSMEQNKFFEIVEVNNELEYRLGYKREELTGVSANRLMPDHIAKKHQEWVKRFLQTMQSDLIGVEKNWFLRHQKGWVVACRATKKIVPTLEDGLQGAMLLYRDPSISLYTSQRTDHTLAKV